jgi:hypothetical protein
MTVDWRLFFLPGTRVLALPSWQNPRLYLPAQSFTRRWEGSSLYPASRFQARLYRSLLRVRATMGLVAARTVQSSDWPLGDFTQDVLLRARAAAVLVGTSGSSHKLTARLQDEKGRDVGYLKYAETDVARQKLRQERDVLSGIPDDLGPKLLKYGAMGEGEALLMTPLTGKNLPATLPPAEGVIGFLDSLAVLPPVPVEAHPWMRHAREQQSDSELVSCFEALSGKNWPIVIQHRDFAPWNLLRRPDGSIGAVDWEWSILEGFPYLDFAYYVLRTASLLYRWVPPKAVEYAGRYLSQQPEFGLNNAETRALIRLTAHDVCQKSLEVGRKPDPWWLAVWESRR